MSDDDDFGTQPRGKSQTFTIKERKLILKLVNKHYDIVHNKKVDSKSTNQKNLAWDAIHQEFSAQTNIVKLSRTPQQLKRCWENLRSKAKKGDMISQKLIQWGENKHKRSMENGNMKEISGSDDASDPLFDIDTDSSIDDADVLGDELKEAHEASEAALEETLKQFSELVSTGRCQQCQHCQCDKSERLIRAELMKLEKRQKELIHRLKLQHLRAKAKREKELHKLAVHELSLKVENERRRADILDKELNLRL